MPTIISLPRKNAMAGHVSSFQPAVGGLSCTETAAGHLSHAQSAPGQQAGTCADHLPRARRIAGHLPLAGSSICPLPRSRIAARGLLQYFSTIRVFRTLTEKKTSFAIVIKKTCHFSPELAIPSLAYLLVLSNICAAYRLCESLSRDSPINSLQTKRHYCGIVSLISDHCWIMSTQQLHSTQHRWRSLSNKTSLLSAPFLSGYMTILLVLWYWLFFFSELFGASYIMLYSLKIDSIVNPYWTYKLTCTSSFSGSGF